MGKKVLNSNVFSTCSHNMVNFSQLAAETCWRVWGTPANFNGAYLRAKFHLDPSNRLATVHQRYRQNRQDNGLIG